MTSRAFGRLVPLIVALSLAGAIALVLPVSARATDRHAPAASTDAQIAWLQKKLHITAAQMPQWNALAAAMRENAKRIALSHADRAKIHPTDAIDTLYADRRETQARLERLERVIPAAEGLFAVLSKDQKATADRLFGGLMRRHRPILDTGG